MTKILAISDVHGKKSESLINYLKQNDDISLVLIAGDITDFSITEFEPLSFVKPFIDELVEECDVDVFAIPGNCDPAGICNAIKESGPDEKPAFCRLFVFRNNLHKLIESGQSCGITLIDAGMDQYRLEYFPDFSPQQTIHLLCRHSRIFFAQHLVPIGMAGDFLNARNRPDLPDQPGREVQRAEEQPLRFAGQLAALERIERHGGVTAHCLIGGEEHQVGILLGGRLIVVSGADLREVFRALRRLALDHAELRVHLVVAQAVADLAAGVLQHARVVNVVLLVKPRAQLQEAHHALALRGGVGQRRRDAAAAREPVERDADALHVRRVRRLVQQVDKRVDPLIGEGDEQLVVVEIFKIVAFAQCDGLCALGQLPPQMAGDHVAPQLLHEREIRRH